MIFHKLKEPSMAPESVPAMIFHKPKEPSMAPAPAPAPAPMIFRKPNAPVVLDTKFGDLSVNRSIDHINMRMTVNRLGFDIVISGLQKSIRRCLLPEAWSYVIEGDLCALVEKTGKAKGNRTNLETV